MGLHFCQRQAPQSVETCAAPGGHTRLLRPDKHAQHAVIAGAVGTGKSTAVRKAILQLEEPKGAVYFLPPTMLFGFSSALANALGYNRPAGWADRVANFFTGESKPPPAVAPTTSEPHATWMRLEPCLVKAAARYRAKHGAPPVLVLDAMDLVAKEDPSFFLEVQDFARRCADTGILRVVLVVSEGRGLPLLQSLSTDTRAGVIYEVGDVSDNEATEWLTKNYNLDAARAAALVDTVAGGRLWMLSNYGASSRSVDAISRELDIQTGVDLLHVGLRPDAPLFRALLSANAIATGKAHALLPGAKLQQLLSRNILSAHPDGTYTFHDRHVLRYMVRAGQR